MPKLECISYEAQLGAIQILVKCSTNPSTKLTLLSIAESIKQARDHNLNCPNESASRSNRQSILCEAAIVVENSKIIPDAGRKEGELKQALADGIRLFGKSDVPAVRFLYTVR